ncbi:hypothetical protein GCM10009757_33020 [Streptomyces cheonanensis]|uniref:Uncharacterized protein n=1 Tax=Streptomyces cheonanensis TaxID=312720 RepID=A0ABP5GSE9_9ACTN|nr:hypothetical protein [Streptomyces sp. AA0539]
MHEDEQGSALPDLSGLIASDVFSIVDSDGSIQGLQIFFRNGTSLVCTVWTDWTVALKKEATRQIPDYFWPPSDYNHQEIGVTIPQEGTAITLGPLETDVHGSLVGLTIRGTGFSIAIASEGGEMQLTVLGSRTGDGQSPP